MLKSVSGGIRVQVEFDQPVKVLLMDKTQYKRYKGGISYTYYGGGAESSPAMVRVPRKGDWHLVVEIGSYFENKEVDVKVSLLPPGEITSELTQQVALAPVVDKKLAKKIDKILDEADEVEQEVSENTEESSDEQPSEETKEE